MKTKIILHIPNVAENIFLSGLALGQSIKKPDKIKKIKIDEKDESVVITFESEEDINLHVIKQT